MIYEDPCEHCGQPLTVRENGNVEDLTYVNDCAIRCCIHCCKPLSLESIDDVVEEPFVLRMAALNG